MFLVFDVGGTFVKHAVMTIEGKIVEQGKFPTPASRGAEVQPAICSFVEALGAVYDDCKTRYALEGAAVSLPGRIDIYEGIVYGGGFLTYLDQVHLADLLSNRFEGLKVTLENDAKCATLAEGWIGNAKDAKSAFVIVFGTGVGGGFLMDGKLNRGQDMCAGEISFLFDDMIMSKLGNIRPIEELNTHEEFVALPCISWNDKVSMWPLRCRVARHKEMDVADVSGELMYQWAKDGDPYMIETLEKQYLDIARGLCNIYALLAPEVILIGGGISSEPRFMNGILKYVNQLKNLTYMFQSIRVERCKYGNDSNLIGALYHYLQLNNLL